MRYARFEGEVAARAEEHIVWVGPEGALARREHRLAEETAGAALPEDEARTLARDAPARLGGAADLAEVSAESSRRPARTDWTFTFRDETAGDLAGGEARVAVEIAGDEVVDTGRYVMNGLSTAQPLPLQVGIGLAGGLIGAGLVATLLGLLAGHVAVLATGASAADRRSAARTGFAIGLGALGALALAGTALGRGLPPWSAYGPASSVAPWLGAALAPVQGYLTLTLLALLVVTSANTLTAHWTRRQTAAAVALVLVGGLLAPGTAPDDLLSWMVVGLLSGALLLGAYVWVLRQRPALAVLAAAAMTVPNILDRGLDQAYGGALFGSLLGAVAVSYIAWRWFAHQTPAPVEAMPSVPRAP